MALFDSSSAILLQFLHRYVAASVEAALCDTFGLDGDLCLPEHVSYIKLLERLQDMLHSAMQGLESSVVDFVQALHLKLSAC